MSGIDRMNQCEWPTKRACLVLAPMRQMVDFTPGLLPIMEIQGKKKPNTRAQIAGARLDRASPGTCNTDFFHDRQDETRTRGTAIAALPGIGSCWGRKPLNHVLLPGIRGSLCVLRWPGRPLDPGLAADMMRGVDQIPVSAERSACFPLGACRRRITFIHQG